MFFSMKLSIQQFYDIKFILSGKSKSEIAKEIGVSNSNQFSSLDRYKSLCERLDQFFDDLNPEINLTVRKISNGTSVEFDVVGETETKYNGTPKAELDKLRFDLAVEKRIVANFDKRWHEYQDERDDLIKKIWTLETENIQFRKKLGIKIDTKAS